MKRLPKGPLKVIHINRKAIGENETRARATLGGEPRRLVPVVSVWTKLGKIEGFGVRIKGEVRLRYEITRFPQSYEFGTPDVRCWIETTDAVDVEETVGELTSTTEKEETNGE